MSGGARVLWAVQGLLVGALALLSGISLKREAAIHSLNRSVSYHLAKVNILGAVSESHPITHFWCALHREVGELRGLLISLAEREGTVEQEVFNKNIVTSTKLVFLARTGKTRLKRWGTARG